MEFKRYLVFAGISLAIHGVAFSANYKPIVIAPISTGVSTTVSIQLIPSSMKEPTRQEVLALTPESALKTKPVAEPKTDTATTIASKPKPNLVPQTKQAPKPVKTTKSYKKAEPFKAAEPLLKEKPTKEITKKIKQQPIASSSTPVEPIRPSQIKPSRIKPSQIKPSQPARSSAPKMVKKPSFSAKPAPIEYPRNAKRRNIEGLVLVEIWIDEQGHQTKQMIIDSSGHPTLDKAAMKAITQWQFKSYRDQGQLIAHRVQVPITFELN